MSENPDSKDSKGEEETEATNVDESQQNPSGTEVEPDPNKDAQELVKKASSTTTQEQEPQGSDAKDSSEVKKSSSKGKHKKGCLSRSCNYIFKKLFDFNPQYFLQMRGVMNILRVIFNLVIIILIGRECQLRPHPTASSEAFKCPHTSTFLFVVACSAYITSSLILCTCFLSKITEILLYNTFFEVAYYVTYFTLFLTGSLAVIVGAIMSDSKNDEEKGYRFDIMQTAAVIGLINSFLYGVGGLWFFLSHRITKYEEKEQSLQLRDEENVLG